MFPQQHTMKPLGAQAPHGCIVLPTDSWSTLEGRVASMNPSSKRGYEQPTSQRRSTM